MKIKYIHPYANGPIDPTTENHTDKKIIIEVPSSDDNSAVTKNQLDSLLKDIQDSTIVGQFRPDQIAKFIGDDITHHDDTSLELKARLPDNSQAIKVDINDKGIITKAHPISLAGSEVSLAINWNKVIQKGSKLADYKIVDIARTNQAVTLKELSTVSRRYPVNENATMPFKDLRSKLAEFGVTLTVGSIIAKVDGADSTGFYLCNAAKINSKDDPDLVLFLTGDPKATEAILPDSSVGDRDRFLLSGVTARSYIKRFMS